MPKPCGTNKNSVQIIRFDSDLLSEPKNVYINRTLTKDEVNATRLKARETWRKVYNNPQPFTDFFSIMKKFMIAEFKVKILDLEENVEDVMF